MHLAVATPEYPPHVGGGLLKFYDELLPHVAAAGVRVTVVVANVFSPDFEDCERDGVRVVCVPGAEARQRAAQLPQFAAAPVLRGWLGGALAAADRVAGLDADVVEATDFGLMFLPFVTGLVPAPLVVQGHGSVGQIADREPPVPGRMMDGAFARLLESAGLRRAHDVQAYSPANAREWQHRLEREVTFLPPVIRAGATPSAPAGRGVLVAARVQPWKGPDVLCQAVEMLLDRGRAVDVTWAGRDTSTASDGRSYGASLAGRFPLVWGRSVRPVGPLACEDLGALRERSRVVLVPSLWDTFNFTVPEAMAAGRVVVCSGGAGASYLVRDGENGFLFPAGDARALSAALERALDLTDAEARTMGERARVTVIDELAPGTVVPKRIERWAEIATRAPRPVDDWLARLCTPGDNVTLNFLDGFPARDVAGYLAARVRDKLVPGA